MPIEGEKSGIGRRKGQKDFGTLRVLQNGWSQNVRNVVQLWVWVPPLPEQQGIVGILIASCIFLVKIFQGYLLGYWGRIEKDNWVIKMSQG